jgi:MYXO-CTERM domain-containing protein
MARASWSVVLGALGLGSLAGPSAAVAAPPDKLDVLIVVDNSTSMGEEQEAFNQAFPTFIAQLLGVGGDNALPDLHVGVISTSAGTGEHPIQPCMGEGDDGVLQVTPRLAGCTAPGPEPYVKDEIGPDGVTRVRNYDGALVDSVACVATLGIGGCGFEQPLAALERALDPSNTANAGFLRPDAALAIVIISDEDDCSATDRAIFDTTQQAIDSPLGPLNSFRCTEFGVTCDGGHVGRAPATYTGCAPRTDSYLADPLATAALVRSLKATPGHVVVAVIGAPPAPFVVALNDMNLPWLQPSCASNFGTAVPAVRLRAFAEAFPMRHYFGSICGDESGGYGTFLAEFGSLARSVMDGSAPPVGDADAGPTTPDAGSPAAPVGDDDRGGCGCRVGDARAPGGPGAALAVLAALAVHRGRRRR